MNPRGLDDCREALRKVQKLYSTPQVLAKALELIHDPDVDLSDLSTLVSRDAALAADLLHLSNSAIYSRGGDCTSLQLAVQRLGMREVIRAIGLSLSKNVFGKGLSNYGINANEYWELSVRAGLLMEQLARRGRVESEEAYLVGILHAIGRVLVNEVLEELGRLDTWDGQTLLESWELEHVGFTHAEAGALLLVRWDFPEPIRIAVAGQFGPITSASSGSLTGLLRFTVALLRPTGGLQPAHVIRETLGQHALIWAGFQEWEELDAFLATAQETFEKVRAGFGPA
jgi:HD-like signal output (HDOD) protein